MDFTNTKDILEFIVAAITVAGFSIPIYTYMIKPCWLRFVYNPIMGHISKIDKMAETVNIINTEILPVIQSLNKEFSKNSGKSIMDRILRIDDNTRLAELRSKLIASNLVTTGMVEFDKTGQLVWANKAFLNMTGLDSESVKSNSWVISIEEDFRDKVWALWQNSIKYNIPFESEFIIKHQQTGITEDVKCTIYPHKSVDGTILGYHGTITQTH
jgi:PAS domain S-box-containing protein